MLRFHWQRDLGRQAVGMVYLIPYLLNKIGQESLGLRLHELWNLIRSHEEIPRCEREDEKEQRLEDLQRYRNAYDYYKTRWEGRITDPITCFFLAFLSLIDISAAFCAA
jgi:hypothetical protein